MELITTALMTCSVISTFAAAGGIVAYRKRRRPIEGLLLGLVLGPAGVVVEAMLPSVGRPKVCRQSRDSFRSLTTYQAARASAGSSVRTIHRADSQIRGPVAPALQSSASAWSEA